MHRRSVTSASDSIGPKRSHVTRCTLFIVLYLCLMPHSVMHAVLGSQIGMLMRLLLAELRMLYHRLLITYYPIKNLRHVLGVSLEKYFSPVGNTWHLLP